MNVTMVEVIRSGDITDNGKKIDLSTPEKLYDYLLENQDKEQE